MISLKSEVTQKLLNYFFINPEESLYVNELARKLKVDKRNLSKKIAELEKEGLLKSSSKGNLKLYSINQNYSLYDEYKNIILKTIGLENQLKKILKKTSGVKNAYLYGSYAQDKMESHSDIDLLVIGEHNSLKLQKNINKLQKDIDREINVVNIDLKEFKRRLKTKNPFILRVMNNKYIKLL